MADILDLDSNDWSDVWDFPFKQLVSLHERLIQFKIVNRAYFTPSRQNECECFSIFLASISFGYARPSHSFGDQSFRSFSPSLEWLFLPYHVSASWALWKSWPLQQQHRDCWDCFYSKLENVSHSPGKSPLRPWWHSRSNWSTSPFLFTKMPIVIEDVQKI